MEVVIVAARRSPIGRFQGSLKALSASQIGSIVVKQCIKDIGLDVAKVDEVIVGQVLQAGCGQNPARQTSMLAGLPETVPSYTINKVCGSGLKVVDLASQAIQTGSASVVIAGGQECMSQAPHLVPGKASRLGQKLGPISMLDSMVHDGLTCAFNHYHMGITAENIAEKYGVSRADQDAFALASQAKAKKAKEEDAWAAQTVALEELSHDEHMNPKASSESLERLKPAFKKGGTVTAGNASGLNDGAAFVIVTSRQTAEANQWPILCSVRGFGAAGLDPKIMGMGPVPATQKCLAKCGWSVGELDLVESNEAFAAQSVAVCRELGLDPARVNVNGGAIALGHPIGGSGTRILVDLISEMRRRNAKKGLATMCIGGGQGVAVAVEREQAAKL